MVQQKIVAPREGGFRVTIIDHFGRYFQKADLNIALWSMFRMVLLRLKRRSTRASKLFCPDRRGVCCSHEQAKM